MRKQGELMPSLVLERLPKAVIAALEGPSVKQDLVSLQSLPALDMTTVAMLLRRKIHYTMPLLQVSLERLPDSVMSNLVSKKNGSAVIRLSDVTTQNNSLLSTKISKGPTLPSLEVALQRIPDATMTSLLAHRKAMLLVISYGGHCGKFNVLAAVIHASRHYIHMDVSSMTTIIEL